MTIFFRQPNEDEAISVYVAKVIWPPPLQSSLILQAGGCLFSPPDWAGDTATVWFVFKQGAIAAVTKQNRSEGEI